MTALSPQRQDGGLPRQLDKAERLNLRNVSKHYHCYRDGALMVRKVLDGIDFGLGSGQVAGLVGKTGVGKTTLARLLAETPDRFAWFSFSCRDGEHISDGTPIRECAALFENDPQVVAVGVNCTAPRLISC